MKKNHTGPQLFDAALFGRAVRACAEERGISLREVGRQAGVSPATLTRTGTDGRRPDVETFARLCRFMRVPVGLFFKPTDATKAT